MKRLFSTLILSSCLTFSLSNAFAIGGSSYLATVTNDSNVPITYITVAQGGNTHFLSGCAQRPTAYTCVIDPQQTLNVKYTSTAGYNNRIIALNDGYNTNWKRPNFLLKFSDGKYSNAHTVVNSELKLNVTGEVGIRVVNQTA